MGLFDFLKGKPAGPSAAAQQDLANAVAAMAAQRNQLTQSAFESALSQAILFLGVRNVPPSIGSGANRLEEDTPVSVLESSTPSGERVLFAFTSPEEVRSRNPEAGIIGSPARDVLEMVIENEYDVIAIDPAGNVLELRRAEVAALLSRL